MSRYEQLLRNLAALMELAPTSWLLATQEIVINGVTISLMLEGDGDIGDVVFCTSLGTPATDNPERLHILMLQANALWAGTGGCTLGLQYGTNAVLLAGRTPLPLCYAKGFADRLAAFSEIALQWKAIVQGRTPVELSAAPSSDALA